MGGMNGEIRGTSKIDVVCQVRRLVDLKATIQPVVPMVANIGF